MTEHRATEAYYDEFSDWYERERGHGYHALIDDLEVAVAEPYARGARVLEVGCGTGLILSRLAERAHSAVGIDLSRGMLARARARGLDVAQALATELPFPDASFDLVCSFKVLAHVPNIHQAMREMARVTAPGGHVVAEFYNPYSLRYLAKRFGGPGAISAKTREDAVYTRFDSARAIRQLLPASLQLEAFRGVRTFVPTARVMNMPLVGRALRIAEFAAQRSPLAYVSGFLVAVARKV
jgi:ubiquinone/menaquinone biosynthesis C-methylase UbiE